MTGEQVIDFIRQRRDKLKALAGESKHDGVTAGQMADTLTELINELEEMIIADTPTTKDI